MKRKGKFHNTKNSQAGTNSGLELDWGSYDSREMAQKRSVVHTADTEQAQQAAQAAFPDADRPAKVRYDASDRGFDETVEEGRADDLEYIDIDSLMEEQPADDVPDSASARNHSARHAGKSQHNPHQHNPQGNSLPQRISLADHADTHTGTHTNTHTGTQHTSPKHAASARREQTDAAVSPAPRRNAPSKHSDLPQEDHESASERLHDPAFWVHIILPVAIIAVALIAFVRYQIWARGEDIQIDASNQTRFNVEVNDEMVLLPAASLEGHEDDGVTTILCLGDAPFSDDTSESGLAGQIASLSQSAGTNVETINASIPDSQVACYNTSYQTDTQHDMEDTFNLFYVAYAISIGDYSTMETVASLHPDNAQYAAAVENLKNTDFSKVDMIVIMYDGIDYVNQSPAYNPDLPVSEQINTYQGALSNAFTLIQQKYPYIRIIFLSPTYMLLEDSQGNLEDARTQDIGSGTLVQYWQYAMDVCADNSVSFIDNYYGSVNDSNYTEYLSDNMHLNNAGRTKVADHFVYKVIENQYAEYDVGSLAVAQ